MKKKISFILIVLISFIVLINYKNNKDDFPDNIPKTNITVNNVVYKTEKGEGTWTSGKLPNGNISGSSYLVDYDEEFTEKCSFIEVHPNDDLKFDISYNEKIQRVTLYKIDSKNCVKKQDSLILNEPYSFKAPNENGEYYYALNVKWDDNHNFDYLFKITCFMDI